jgi:hypothetical protein
MHMRRITLAHTSEGREALLHTLSWSITPEAVPP